MESLEGLWKKLSLLDEEETGIACPKKAEPDTFTLAAKFLTKRVVNMESVARTFRPLWRSEKDVQIKDMGDNILFFNFEDECDLDRVLEHEPWTYDKHLVVFEKVTANVPLSSLAFQFTTFWIQIHELPVQCLNQETRDAIGSSLGKPLLMTDTESEGEIDITTRKTSITVPGTRPKHPKSKKPPPQTPTASNIQSPPSQPRDLPPTPATIPTTVTTTAVNEVIIAHQSVVEWQENQALNVPNGCISGTEEAIVEKSSINANIDDKEKVFNSSHSNTETKLDLKPKVLSQHIPTTIGPCTTHQPTITTQSQPHLIPTTIGPCTNHQPTNITQSQTKPLPTKSTWVRIPRDIQSIPNDVLMIERKHKRSDESEEGSLSDHSPLWICTDDENARFYRKRKPFRFEAVWMKDEGCEAVIKNSWETHTMENPMDRVEKKIRGMPIISSILE
nr:hypothetical protein CFP56_59907 [Quercus suber]